MKLHELFNKPTANGAGGQALMFDNGDLIITKAGEPGQVMSPPDDKGNYLVKLKNGREVTVHSSELKLATNESVQVKWKKNIDWNCAGKDWAVAKAEGKKIFDRETKTLHDIDIDEVLAMRAEAEAERKKGSYLGAVLADKFKELADNVSRSGYSHKD